jgi:poly-gamma-glutamate synthesis protein (capsule biosynthesis protein)
LHCVSLGFGEPRSRRGTPQLASVEDAERITGYVAELSEPFGTRLEFIDGRGRIEL